MIDEQDDALEGRLRRVRPVGPPAALRTRILTAATTRPAPLAPRWVWMSAAAVLLAAVALHWQATRAYDRVAAATLTAEPAGRDADIAALAREWGGSAGARQAAESTIDALNIDPRDVSVPEFVRGPRQ